MEKFTLSRIFEAVDRCCSWFDASLAYQGLSAGFPELVMNTKLRANVAFWQGRVNSKYKLLEAPYPPSYSLWAFLQKAEITIQENTWKRFISVWVWSIIAQSDISVKHSALGFIDQSIRQSTFDDNLCSTSVLDEVRCRKTFFTTFWLHVARFPPVQFYVNTEYCMQTTARTNNIVCSNTRYSTDNLKLIQQSCNKSDLCGGYNVQFLIKIF